MPDYTEQLAQARAAGAQQEQENAAETTEKETESPKSDIGGLEFAIIGLIAALNDLCDWIALDLLLFRMIDFCTAIILGLWCWLRLKKFPGARFGASFIIELIPFLGDLSPTWTIFVISTYAEQKGLSGPIKKISEFIKK